MSGPGPGGQIIYDEDGRATTDAPQGSGGAIGSRETTLSTNLKDYSFNYKVFPENLGVDENNHYMVIYINVQTGAGAGDGSNYSAPTNTTDLSTAETSRLGPLAPRTTETNRFTNLVGLDTKRISDAIAFHMPNGGLNFVEDNKYEEASMTAMAGTVLSGVASLASKALGAAGGEKVVKVFDSIAGFIGAAGTAAASSAKLAGRPINPMAQVLFATRPQRQWIFEVLLVPTTPSEAKTVQNIIQTLRFHAAPELTAFGTIFIPPAEFDIIFYRNGAPNPNLPRLNTCVLERIDLDYAPQNGVYSAYRDGHPVAVRLAMSFRELEILHKDLIAGGF